MARGGYAPTNAVWIICLILYVVALLATFGILPVAGELVRWAWIIGFGLSKVLHDLRIIATSAAYLALLAVVIVDVWLLYRFFSPRRDSKAAAPLKS